MDRILKTLQKGPKHYSINGNVITWHHAFFLNPEYWSQNISWQLQLQA